MESNTIVATPEMCALCFDQLYYELQSRSSLSPRPSTPNRSISIPNEKVSLFVTWDKYSTKERDYVLRGCIGTFSRPTLFHGLKKYSIVSAFEDNRFTPIQLDEVSKLRCSINLLHQYEIANHVYDWEIGAHGIHIQFTNPFNGRTCSATYLPSVMLELNWSKDEALSSLYRKAGYRHEITESLKKNTILQRYRSSICKLTHEEYSEKYQFSENVNDGGIEKQKQGLVGSIAKLS